MDRAWVILLSAALFLAGCLGGNEPTAEAPTADGTLAAGSGTHDNGVDAEGDGDGAGPTAPGDDGSGNGTSEEPGPAAPAANGTVAGEGEGDDAAPEPTVYERPFFWDHAVGTSASSVCINCSVGFAVRVPNETAQLDINITWECTSQFCDLDAAAYGPGWSFDFIDDHLEDRSVQRESGGGPFTWVLESPEPGEWSVVVNADGYNGGLEGTVTFTVRPAA